MKQNIYPVWRKNRVFLVMVLLICFYRVAIGAPGKKNVKNSYSNAVLIHSHNDYLNPDPLRNALKARCQCIEADIILKNGRLYVAHDTSGIVDGNELENMYLKPLAKESRSRGGWFYQDKRPLILMIDIKRRGEETYEELKKTLSSYADILTSFKNDTAYEKAVTIVLSGDRPIDMISGEGERLVALDGRINDLETGFSPFLYPMISDDWNEYFTWRGEGEMPKEELELLRAISVKARERGSVLRFWGLPDTPVPAREKIWKRLIREKVGLIGTDSIKALRDFLDGGRWLE